MNFFTFYVYYDSYRFLYLYLFNRIANKFGLIRYIYLVLPHVFLCHSYSLFVAYQYSLAAMQKYYACLPLSFKPFASTK